MDLSKGITAYFVLGFTFSVSENFIIVVVDSRVVLTLYRGNSNKAKKMIIIISILIKDKKQEKIFLIKNLKDHKDT